MCGIIGYVGDQKVISVLLDGLRRMEYRGYDSSGVAYFSPEGQLEVRRSAGKLAILEAALSDVTPSGHAGIGHTRWATHGKPSEQNAHPHCTGSLALVQNGILENYLTLKEMLKNDGRLFSSETDTEVIVHLIDRACQQGIPLEEAVLQAMREMRGSFSFCLMSDQMPDRIIAVRFGCPLVVGVGEGEVFIASDVPAFLSHTRDVLFLEEGEMVVASRKGVEIRTLQDLRGLRGQSVKRKPERILWDPVMAEKGGFRHFMQKEIHEQPRALMDTLGGRIFQETGEVRLDGTEMDGARYRRAMLIGCGTSWHAALVGKFLIEEIAGLPTEVDIASEFRYRNSPLTREDLIIAISQSGETADTLAAVRAARGLGLDTLAICNVLGSSLSREGGAIFYTHAGPEIAVASTKAFTTQIAALFLVALHLGQSRKRLSRAQAQEMIQHLIALPKQIEQILRRESEISDLARRYFQCRDFLYLGRGIHYPVALEGALKLKEISYIHAEGYPAGEMKHGPIALIDEQMPVVVLAPRDGVYEKMISNTMEVKARSGKILAFVEEGDTQMRDLADECFFLPRAPSHLSPILMTIPLQLLAYHIALLRGSDVDQPRNLAKSVTVE
jgi:glucosamine--fructose-6-phosphate aminotransferase (isomerizing)